MLGLVSSGFGWDAVLILQLVLSAFASVAIYRAIHLETNEYQKILMSKVTKEENLADASTTIKMI